MSEEGEGEKAGKSAEKVSLGARALGLLSEVHPNEGPRTLALAASIFILLLAYYVLKTVREPLVLASAAQDLQLLGSATWIPEWLRDAMASTRGPQLKAVAAGAQTLLLALFIPAYSWLSSRLDRIKLIGGVTLFFIVCIEIFFGLRLMQVPMLGFFFYIWVGIFSVAMIAQFWSFANDLHTEEQGGRLFPVIGIGATLGSPIGSKLAGALFDWLGGLGLPIDPAFVIMQIPALLLALFVGLTVWSSRMVASEAENETSTGDKAEENKVEKEEMSAEGALSLIFGSPYLRWVAMLLLLLNLVNTVGEFILSQQVVEAATEAVANDPSRSIGSWIGAFYGDFFFWVNNIAFLLQAFVVSRLVKKWGLKALLIALPVVALSTYGLFALGLGLSIVRWAKTAENATDYSIMNTGKALLWLPTTRAEKYKAKQAVDTIFVRTGDLLAAVFFIVGTTLFDLELAELALANLGLVVLWLGLTALVLRRHAELQQSRSEVAPTDA